MGGKQGGFLEEEELGHLPMTSKHNEKTRGCDLMRCGVGWKTKTPL